MNRHTQFVRLSKAGKAISVVQATELGVQELTVKVKKLIKGEVLPWAKGGKSWIVERIDLGESFQTRLSWLDDLVASEENGVWTITGSLHLYDGPGKTKDLKVSAKTGDTYVLKVGAPEPKTPEAKACKAFWSMVKVLTEGQGAAGGTPPPFPRWLKGDGNVARRYLVIQDGLPCSCRLTGGKFELASAI